MQFDKQVVLISPSSSNGEINRSVHYLHLFPSFPSVDFGTIESSDTIQSLKLSIARNFDVRLLGAGCPGGSGHRAGDPRSCGLRVRIPSPSGLPTLPTMGTSVTDATMATTTIWYGVRHEIDGYIGENWPSSRPARKRKKI